MSKFGKLLIFSAPSGAGKTSIVKELLNRIPELGFSISATSRNTVRDGEVHGRDYYFLSPEEFKEKIENAEFVEWEEVYEGTFYGTLRSEIERLWDEGKHVIFDIDVQGGLNLKEQFGDRALSIFVQPPSIEILKERLKERGTEDDYSYKERTEKAEEELSFSHKFDKIVKNIDLNEAVEEAEILVKNFIS